MNKKWAIFIIVGVTALAYLFLLVGLPALEGAISAYGSCNSSETVNNNATPEVTANWTSVGPPLDVEPKEKYRTPLIIYFVPGLISIVLVAKILSQKKEGT